MTGVEFGIKVIRPKAPKVDAPKASDDPKPELIPPAEAPAPATDPVPDAPAEVPAETEVVEIASNKHGRHRAA